MSRFAVPLLASMALIPAGQALAEESTLGAIPALSNSNNASSGVAVSPPTQLNTRSRLSPVIVLPPESVEPRTLVVPLPSEGGPPVVLRKNSIEVVPSLQPALPKSKASPDAGNATGNRKPLPPVVD
ncbi:hypothetical protein [Methylovorus mays]|uniref:hypothetical protein n=1 Tax=Methylovorus mays TaxID=184077 RepID=UPI001E58BACF|nr:hypothetical protein [Methylovorus mays]MCB5207782.1 hypothetical protein [Methylovorus mays]